jgi:hypothetical protein
MGERVRPDPAPSRGWCRMSSASGFVARSSLLGAILALPLTPAGRWVVHRLAPDDTIAPETTAGTPAEA